MGYLERQQNKNLNFQPHLRPLNLPSNPYTKAYKTPGQQVSLLQSRGLEILDLGWRKLV